MEITLCRAKIHRARITDANLDYEGSITIDPELMAAAGIVTYEKVQVVNVNNGTRLETYVIDGKTGSGDVCLNGPAARLGQVGDLIIIIAYGQFTLDESREFEPRIVNVDENNRPIR
ncbi:aspartate 1-decarboxylase [Candidatus Zixiibacteriota bacterium]